jgi:opacity protein-like surface antigen
MRVQLATGTFCAAIALAVVTVGATPAAAQSGVQAGTWTVTPFLGGSMGLDTDPADAGGNSFGLGVAVGYDLTRNIGFEGELGHLFDTAGDTELVDWSVTNFSGNFLYHFDTQSVITPYATFGLGFERSSIDTDDETLALVLPSSTEISFNFGGGVKYPLNDSLLVRGDLRRFQSNDLAPDYWRVYAGLTFTFKQ